MASSLFTQSNPLNQVNNNILNQAKSIMNNMGQIKGIMNMLNGKGMSAEQMVRSMCKQQGIDVNQLMSMLK